MEEVTTRMRQKDINNMEWVYREQWRRRIKLRRSLNDNVRMDLKEMGINTKNSVDSSQDRN